MEVIPETKYSLKGMKTKQNSLSSIVVEKVSNFTIVTKSANKLLGKETRMLKKHYLVKE